MNWKRITQDWQDFSTVAQELFKLVTDNLWHTDILHLQDNLCIIGQTINLFKQLNVKVKVKVLIRIYVLQLHQDLLIREDFLIHRGNGKIVVNLYGHEN